MNPEPEPADAEVNPLYPIDLKYAELTPANSTPEPTVFPINTEPVIKFPN